MKKNKKERFLQENILRFRKLYQQKKFGKLSLASLIYLILKAFIPVNKREDLSKLQELAYKALKRSPWLGKSLLKAYAMLMFLPVLKEWSKRNDTYKSEHRLSIRIDRSSTGEHYGEKIPYLKILYDYVKKYHKKTHHIEVLLVSLGKRDFVLDFEIIKYENTRKKGKKRKKISKKFGYCTTVKMLKGLLRRTGSLKNILIQYGRLSLDGWYGKEEMFIGLYLLGFQRAAMKSGGIGDVVYNGQVFNLTEFKELLKRRKKFKTFNPKHKLGDCKYLEENIRFKTSGLKLRAIFLKYTGKVKVKDRYLLLLSICPKEEWHAYQIVQCYKSRWGIEVMFRTCKQIHDLEGYSYHSEDVKNIEMHFALCFIGYMWLNWYRVEYTRMSITQLKDVKNSWIDLFNTMSAKSIQNLFSG